MERGGRFFCFDRVGEGVITFFRFLGRDLLVSSF